MTRLILGLVIIALTASGCGSGGGSEPVSPAATEPAATAASAAPAAPVEAAAPEPPRPEPSGAVPLASRRATSRPAAPVSPPAKAAAPGAPSLPEYRQITVPAGTPLALELTTAVGSDASQVEDTVRATLREAITIDGLRVLPAGTELVGTVTSVQRAGRVKGRATIAFRFTTLRHDQERYEVETDPIERIAEATKGEDATKVGVGAGAGAAIGALIGGKSGAAKGAAIGAAAGTGTVLATRGKDVRLERGADVPTRLTAPLIINVPVGR